MRVVIGEYEILVYLPTANSIYIVVYTNSTNLRPTNPSDSTLTYMSSSVTNIWLALIASHLSMFEILHP